MNQSRFMRAECLPVTPEYLRVMHIAERREKLRLDRLAAARRALALANKLKPSATKARHVSRIFSAINRLRAV